MAEYTWYEARDWLTEHQHEHCFAVNCFESMERAMCEVLYLYGSGAVEVWVGGDCIDRPYRDLGDGAFVGPYADMLAVVLPSELRARDQVWRQIANLPWGEDRDVTFEWDDPAFEQRDVVYVWWD